MMHRLAPFCIALAAMSIGAGAFASAGSAGDAIPMPGVANPRQAHIDYMLKCQGCHRPDGTGSETSAPPLRGMVARFLQVEGGRAFLGRVPGVAMTDLDDRRLADVLNWTLYRFDADHMKPAFVPFTAGEIGRLRAQPLRLERIEVRERLLGRMEREESLKKQGRSNISDRE